MKKIVCELCESIEFVKEDGLFVCQGCGTKYSAEEAKSMMREVEGSAPVGGLPVNAVPIGNPNQQQIDNMLVLATTAYEAQNYAETENYCNQVIVLDAVCYKAWNLKGKAVGWQSKIDNLRIEESAHSFCKAIDFAPDDEKEGLKAEAVEELKKLGIALIALRKNRFSGSPDSQELNGFTSDKKTVLSALLILLSHGNAVGIPEGYLDEVATLMNEAGVAALNMARNAWNGVEHPSQKDLTTYLDWNGNICTLFRQAIDTSTEDDEADIQRYKNLIIALKDPIGKYSKTRHWNSFSERYDWVNEYSLNASAVAARKKEAADCEEKIKNIENAIAKKKKAAAKKDEEDRKARIRAYWEAHADEKAALESEKKSLEDKKAKLSKDISEIESQIAVKVPSEEETDKLKSQIKELEDKRSKLGLFAGKEKKQITEEIAALQGRIDSLKSKVDSERNIKNAPLTTKKNELESELDKATKRIKAIETELTKDPEA